MTHSSEEKQARSWDTYNRILLYLRKNYFRIKTIEELASEVNVDPAYLSRVFRRFHNETPYRFLIRLKMGHAASLLLSSRRLVKDIAFELGFEKIPFIFPEPSNQSMGYHLKILFSSLQFVYLLHESKSYH